MAVVSFVNMKGGVGKTTLAVNVAYTLARRFGKKVLLIDLDPQFNATQCFLSGEKYLNLRKRKHKTIVSLFTNPEDIAPDLVSGTAESSGADNSEGTIYQFESNLHLILGDLALYRLEFAQGMGTELQLRRYLSENHLADEYDYILIDCPPTPSVWMISGLLASDSYVIPIKPEPLSRYGIDLFRGIVRRATENHGHNIECAGIVLTMSESNTVTYKETMDYIQSKQEWKDKLFRHQLSKRTRIARIQAEQAFMLDQTTGDLKSMIVSIAQEFQRRIE